MDPSGGIRQMNPSDGIKQMNPQDSHVYSTGSCVQLFDPRRGRIVGVLAGCYKNVMPMASKNRQAKIPKKLLNFKYVKFIYITFDLCIGMPRPPMQQESDL
jgi:hypothetical protein